MPRITYEKDAVWFNYHLTLGEGVGANPTPVLKIKDQATFDAGDVADADWNIRFAATGAALFEHLQRVKGLAADQEHESMAGIVGKGWSFTRLIGTEYSQILCDGLAGTAAISADHLHSDCTVPPSRIAMTSGGTRLRELAVWAGKRDMTLETSGTHLGPSVAGTFATASHGSRLDFGGFQNSVLGMHLIVGDGEHVWIEPSSAPILNQGALDALAIDGKPVRLVRDDKHFQNALIHLGVMGIVNGVALRLKDNTAFAEMRASHPIDGDWLAAIEDGKFSHIAKKLGCSVDPFFYEMTLDPLAPFDKPALHMLYFPSTNAPEAKRELCVENPSEGVVEFAKALFNPGIPEEIAQIAPEHAMLAAGGGDAPTEEEIVAALKLVFKGPKSAFDTYYKIGCFEPSRGTFDPDAKGTKSYLWSQLHGDDITGGYPGWLYNASFSVPRSRTREAVMLITDAVAHLPGSFVFTLRFVSNPDGALAFTRFEENTVIEIDGLSPLACKLAAAQIGLPQMDLAFEVLAGVVPAGARAVRGALDQAKIPYSMHWAKLGELDAAKVSRDFGAREQEHDTDLIASWRATRLELLQDGWDNLFVNPEIKRLGLL